MPLVRMNYATRKATSEKGTETIERVCLAIYGRKSNHFLPVSSFSRLTGVKAKTQKKK